MLLLGMRHQPRLPPQPNPPPLPGSLQYSLLLSQPSVCRLHNQTGPTFPLLLRHPLLRLRFVNYVEVMAPTFEVNFFQQVVRHTLEDREFGESLDCAALHSTYLTDGFCGARCKCQEAASKH